MSREPARQAQGLFPTPDQDTLLEADRFAREIERRQRGEIPEDEFRRMRLQNGIYGIRGQTDVQMVRVKVPFGLITAQQALRLATIAEEFSNGAGHLTTRQCIQFHWLALERIPDLMRQMAEVGLTSREACGHSVRNVTGCPLAGVCRDEVFDVRPHAAAFVRHFLRHPGFQNMPRKFKTSFSGCGRDCAGSPFHDIGAVAALREVDGVTERGFRIYVGGGLAAAPRGACLLEDFTPEAQLLPTAEAILRIFDRLGNRQELHRARLKFLIERIGIEEFRRLVLHERRFMGAVRPRTGHLPRPDAAQSGDEVAATGPGLRAEGPAPALPVNGDPQYNAWLRSNAVPQRQTGYHATFVTVPGGDLTSEQLRQLARMSRRYGDGALRTTITQDLVLQWVEAEDLHALYKDLQDAGLGQGGVNRVQNVVGCPGADTCNLAVTHSHRLALELNRQLAARPEYGAADDLQDVSIKVSGCPNSCGQHHIATIGLYGNARKIGDQQVPYYQLLLGGTWSEGEIRFGRPVMRIPAKAAPNAIFGLLDTYRAQRQAGETFLAWVERLEGEGALVPAMQAALAPFTEVPSREADPDFYIDWGDTGAFKVKIGIGECAAQ